GATLRSFVRAHGALLGPETVALVFSDGLDFGDPSVLRSAANELRRRCAGLVWISPSAELPGFLPTTQALRAVSPFVSAFLGTPSSERLARIGRSLR
ncbi:MAG: VWA domain-containing protein, partial [Candidatus Eremiobacteraeota bacterium]|nr:VWA domain-containing protein [Candidatus Eremiobacteraeota bacterium]